MTTGIVQKCDEDDLTYPEAVIVALGCSLTGHFPTREELIEAALAEFEQRGLHVLARSSHWRSAAWPNPTHPEFRNVLALVETDSLPREILGLLQGIEQKFGRERLERNGPRTLDLDLIAVGREVMDSPELTLPHPRAHDRRFVMGPLAEVAPCWRHPILLKTAVELAASANAGSDAVPV